MNFAITSRVNDFKDIYENKVPTLSLDNLARAIESYESLQEDLCKLQSYAFLEYSVAQRNTEALRFIQDIEEWTSDQLKKLVFFELEINAYPLDEDSYAQSLSLQVYKPWLSVVRSFKKHQLSQPLEQLMQDYAGPAHQAWIRLYDESMASLKVEGQKGQPMTLAEALNKMSSPQGDERRFVAQSLSQALLKQESLWVRIYNALLKDHSIETQWRDFEKASSSIHLRNQIEESVVESLEESVQSSYGAMGHRYYRLKAKMMGVSHLNYWDKNAPIFSHGIGEEKIYTWEEAKFIVLEAYGEFFPEFKQIAQSFFEKKWIHALPLEGKDSGAFSHPTVPSVHPYILLNFYGKNRDVMTLAHELGHGIHQWLARKQKFFMTDTPLTIAETASVFGERLVFETLLHNCRTREEKLVLLSQKIEDMLNTVVRQIGFYQFEQKVHHYRLQGEVAPSVFNSLWMEIQNQVLGDGFVLDQGYRIYWAYISHFIHSPFYVYAYAFGECVVNALYGLYQQGYKNFPEIYKSFLAKGSSQTYCDMLKPFGLNPKDPDFWVKGLAPIGELIDTLELVFHGR